MHFFNVFLYVQQADPLIFIRKNDPSAKSLEYMSQKYSYEAMLLFGSVSSVISFCGMGYH